MRTYKIKAGSHGAWPFPFGLWWNKRKIKYGFVFNDSIRYQLPPEEQLDWNKLFGIGYADGGHHTDSARVVFRYVPGTDLVDIGAYCYINGRQQYATIVQAEVGKWYTGEIEILPGTYKFTIQPFFGVPGNAIAQAPHVMYIPYYHTKKLSYPLGVYFGGTLPAPQDIKILMQKL